MRASYIPKKSTHIGNSHSPNNCDLSHLAVIIHLKVFDDAAKSYSTLGIYTHTFTYAVVPVEDRNGMSVIESWDGAIS